MSPPQLQLYNSRRLNYNWNSPQAHLPAPPPFASPVPSVDDIADRVPEAVYYDFFRALHDAKIRFEHQLYGPMNDWIACIFAPLYGRNFMISPQGLLRQSLTDEQIEEMMVTSTASRPSFDSDDGIHYPRGRNHYFRFHYALS
jgi:hypothetical protein